MASSSAPKHDFAPAWLKIPTNAQRPSGAISGEASIRRDESSNSLNSHFSSKSRNSSIEQRRDRGRSAFSYRHHSIDTDEPQHHSPTYGSGGEYRLTSSQRQQSGSQPSLGRRPLSRQDFRDSSSPSFSSGNKGFNSFESAGDSHRNSSSSHWGRQRSFEHNHNSGNGRPIASSEHGSNAAKKDGGKWKEDKIDKFDKEFPSLRGGKFDNALPTTNVTNGSVWDTNKSGKIHLSTVSKKIHLVQKPIRNDIVKTSSAAGSSTNASSNSSPKSVHHATLLKQTSKNVSNSTNATSVYHTLVPAKGSMVRRPSKDNVKSNGQSSKPSVRSISPPSQSDVLNARLVTQPRRLGNKSEFLKELRVDGVGTYNMSSTGGYKMTRDDRDTEADSQRTIPAVGGSEGDGSKFDYFDYDDKFHVQDSIQKELHQNGSSDHVNDDVDCVQQHKQQTYSGIAIVKPVEEDQMECKALSRSLEAEQRLLREMGWKEEDSEDEAVYAPLTEDEMREFEKLSKQVPKRNGFQRNQLQFTWSPKRVLTIPKTLDLENESSGSSTTESDSD